MTEACGNPYRPIKTNVKKYLGSFVEPYVGQFNEMAEVHWLTPTVRQLAEAVYQSFGERKCERCGGEGGVWESLNPADDGTQPCKICHGTGKLPGYDEEAMAILGDALEEAQAPEELVQHVRGMEPLICKRDCGARHNEHCKLSNGDGWMPLRSPHVRGCWAIDLLTGRE